MGGGRFVRGAVRVTSRTVRYARVARFAPLLLAFAAACASPPASAPTPCAPSPKAAPRTAMRAADAWTELCTGPSSVPMEIAGSREFVKLTIPGSKVNEELRFHVDSGGNTPGLMMPRSVAERLGFSTAESLPRAIRIGDREIALPEGANWILLDDASDRLRFSRSVRGDFSVGQIGAGFLSRFVVCVDPAHGRLGLGDPRRFDLEPGDEKWVPLLFLPQGANHALYPFVHVTLREQGAFAGGYGLLVDTGATSSMIDRNKIDYQRGAHPAWATANGAFGDADMLGGQTPEAVLRADDVVFDAPQVASELGLHGFSTVEVGAATFVERPTGTWRQMFGDLAATQGAHGAIANDVLLRFRLIFDYPHARLFLEPSGRAADASSSSSRVGVALRFGSDGCPEIRQVTDTNEPSTRERLQVGDVLLSVDGENMCARFHHEIARALAGPPGTKKHLQVRRAGSVFEVEAVTAELLARK